jgi:hypothetical protein
MGEMIHQGGALPPEGLYDRYIAVRDQLIKDGYLQYIVVRMTSGQTAELLYDEICSIEGPVNTRLNLQAAMESAEASVARYLVSQHASECIKSQAEKGAAVILKEYDFAEEKQMNSSR